MAGISSVRVRMAWLAGVLRLRMARMLLLLLVLPRPRMMRLSHPRMLGLKPALLSLPTMLLLLLLQMVLVHLLVHLLLSLIVWQLHEHIGVDPTHTPTTAVHQLRGVDSAHVHVHATHATTSTVHQLTGVQRPRKALLLLLLHRSEHVHVHSSRVHVHTVHVDVHPASVGGRGPGSLLGEWVWVHAVVCAFTRRVSRAIHSTRTGHIPFSKRGVREGRDGHVGLGVCPVRIRVSN